MKDQEIILPPEPKRDNSFVTKDELRSIITERLMDFSDALIKRGQILPLSPDKNYGPKVEE